MPVRFSVYLPLVNSIDVLDIVLIPLGFTILLDLLLWRVETGPRAVFLLLTAPVVVCALSLAWSQDRAQTTRALIIYVEGLLAYLVVVREFNGVSFEAAVRYVELFGYLLIVPAILLLLHVPGFEPEGVAGLSHTSGGYLSYYTRLSHPVLGRSNNLATLLAFLVPVLFCVGARYRRRGAVVAGVVLTAAVVATLSRGTMLALVAGEITWLLVRPRSRSASSSPFAAHRSAVRTALAGTGFIALCLLALIIFNPSTRDLIGTRLNLVNADLRLGFAQDAFARLADRPFLGFGGGVSPDPNLAIGVHNTYLQQMLYFGVPLGVFVGACLVLLAVVLLSTARTDPLLAAVGCGVVVQLVVFFVESSFEGTVLRVLFYLIFGLLISVARAAAVSHAAVDAVQSARTRGRSRPTGARVRRPVPVVPARGPQ
jgi:hypothetical protein